MATLAQALFTVGANTNLSSYTPDSGFGGFAYFTGSPYNTTNYEVRTADSKCYVNHTSFPDARCTSDVTNNDFEYYADIARGTAGSATLNFMVTTAAGVAPDYWGYQLRITHSSSTLVQWDLYYIDATSPAALAGFVMDTTSTYYLQTVTSSWSQSTAKRVGVTFTGGNLTVWTEPAGGGSRTTIRSAASISKWDRDDDGGNFPTTQTGQRFGFRISNSVWSIDNLQVDSVSTAQPDPYGEGIPGAQAQSTPRLPLWYGSSASDEFPFGSLTVTEDYPYDGRPLGVPQPVVNAGSLPLWNGAGSEDFSNVVSGTFTKSVGLSALLFFAIVEDHPADGHPLGVPRPDFNPTLSQLPLWYGAGSEDLSNVPLQEDYPGDGHPLGVPRPDFNPTLSSLPLWYGVSDEVEQVTLAYGNHEGVAPVIPPWNWSWRMAPFVDPDPKLPTRKLVTISAILKASYTKSVQLSATLRKTTLKTVGITARVATRVTKTVGLTGVRRLTQTKSVGISARLIATAVTRTRLVQVRAVLRKTQTKTVGITAVKIRAVTVVTKSVTISALLRGVGVTRTVVINAVLIAGPAGILVPFKRFQARTSRR